MPRKYLNMIVLLVIIWACIVQCWYSPSLQDGSLLTRPPWTNPYLVVACGWPALGKSPRFGLQQGSLRLMVETLRDITTQGTRNCGSMVCVYVSMGSCRMSIINSRASVSCAVIPQERCPKGVQPRPCREVAHSSPIEPFIRP